MSLSPNLASADPLSPADELLDPELLKHHSLHSGEKLWQRAWTWGCDLLNPIVVKEIRQSLKSKQFVISFGLTLIATAVWTITILALMMPRVLYLPGGSILLTGFVGILLIPLMLLIPATAYLSLVSEKQNSTFDLLSISSLSAQQIVHGKMASSFVQILLYISALAPCMVLTYLMRGVSMTQIMLLLGWSVVFSLCETAVALLLAAIARTSMLQGVIGILLLSALLFFGFGWFSICMSNVSEFDRLPPEAIMFVVAVLTCLALAIALVLRAAAAAIDFPSENNSTPLRLRVLALVTLILFWFLVGSAMDESSVPVGVYVLVLFFVMLFFGTLVAGELGVISPRAQRGLPRTFIGRVFLTWLYPGAGTGYVFLVCLFAGVVSICIGTEIHFSLIKSTRAAGNTSFALLSYLLLCHFVFYAGLNRLIMLLFPKHLPNRMLASFAVQAVLISLTHMVPLLIVYYFNDYRNFSFAWHQSLNFIWTINLWLENNSLSGAYASAAGTMSVLALVVFIINLTLCTRDLFLVRVAEPERLRQEKEAESPSAAEKVAPDPFA